MSEKGKRAIFRKRFLWLTVFLVLAGGFVFVATRPVYGAAYTWTGGGDGVTWNSAANWGGSGYPSAAADTATIDSTASNISIPSGLNIAGITLGGTYSGTLTQSGTITLGSTGLTVGAGTLTLNGGTVTLNGLFTMSGGTFNLSSSTIAANGGWTYTAGTINPGTSRVTFGGSGKTVTGSHTLYNVTLAPTNFGLGLTIASGTTVTTTGTFQVGDLSVGGFATRIYGPGSIAAQGPIALYVSGGAGALYQATFDLLVNGSGDQVISTYNGVPYIGSLTINKPSGTLSLGSSSFAINENLTYTSGTLDPGTSTVYFIDPNASSNRGGTVSGSVSLYNVSTVGKNNETYTISSGTILTVLGNLSILNSGNGGKLTGPGSVKLYGNMSVSGVNFSLSDFPLTFAGSNRQTYTSSTGGPDFSGNITVDKPSGEVVLASNAGWNSSGQSVTITSGTLSMGNYNLSVGSGGLSIGSAGILRDFGSGDLTLAGNVANNGRVDFRSAGSCGGSNQILIRSSAASQRNWSGSGSATFFDVDVQYQSAVTTMTVYNGITSGNSGNNTNWTFSVSCPTVRPAFGVSSGTWNVTSGTMNVY